MRWRVRLQAGLLLLAAGGMLAVPAPAETVAVPAGQVRPLYSVSSADASGRALTEESQLIEVAAFEMDKYPITNAEFLQFTVLNPKWQRSAVKPIFADENYLTHWAGDSRLSASSPPQSPVVNISWFAAKRYCEARDMTLPTVAQWEYVAAASATELNATDDPEHLQTILNWYQQPTPEVLPDVESTPINAFGIGALHGLVWEWTLDFNTALVTGESRGDSGLDRQLYCGSGSVGASDFRNYAAFMRYAMRSSVDGRFAVGSFGFRCVRNLPEEHS